jgi:hypothetical protein
MQHAQQGVDRRGGGVSGAAAPGSRVKINLLNETLDFLLSTNFKLLCQI